MVRRLTVAWCVRRPAHLPSSGAAVEGGLLTACIDHQSEHCDVTQPERAAALTQIFDSLLGFGRGAGDFPKTPAAAAELCRADTGKEEEEEQEYLVAVLCHLGRVVHVWQEMLHTMTDRGTLPTEEAWLSSLAEAGAVDPRGLGWQPAEGRGSRARAELLAAGREVIISAL